MSQAAIRRVPALMISASASHQGKTTVTAALARLHASQGRRVRVFKTGPDFLDPMLLGRGAGSAAGQLDLWLAGEAACRQAVYDAAADADLILIEGVMGLHDGTPSSADLALALDVPVAVVIDAKGMAQSFGALASGLGRHRNGVRFAGAFGNSVASPRHAEMILQGMQAAGLPYLGGLPRNAAFALPERHLGLVQASEIADVDARLDAVATALADTAMAQLPPATAFAPQDLPAVPRLLDGLRIAVARDAAFSFLYAENLACLQALGARLSFFSPLADTALPETDSIYLPGGYPELHLQRLHDNHAMRDALRRHCAQGKTLYAECGGMLYLLESLTDREGHKASMAGVLSGHATMQSGLRGLGYQSLAMPAGTLRAHTFHHSTMATSMTPVTHGERLYQTSSGEAVYRHEGVTASYLHCYFASAPIAAAQLFLKDGR